GPGAGDQQRREAAQGCSTHIPELLAGLPAGERIEGLPPEARRYRLVVQPVGVRPPVLGVIVSAEQLVDPREVDGEVLVDRLFLRRVMPVMEPREDQVGFQPLYSRAEVR